MAPGQLMQPITPNHLGMMHSAPQFGPNGLLSASQGGQPWQSNAVHGKFVNTVM